MYYPGIFMERQREITKTSVIIAGVADEILTKDLLNADPQRYYWTSLLGDITDWPDVQLLTVSSTFLKKVFFNCTILFGNYMKILSCTPIS
jgi:hypothetical protein